MEDNGKGRTHFGACTGKEGCVTPRPAQKVRAVIIDKTKRLMFVTTKGESISFKCARRRAKKIRRQEEQEKLQVVAKCQKTEPSATA
jgi:hypothetical protein